MTLNLTQSLSVTYIPVVVVVVVGVVVVVVLVDVVSQRVSWYCVTPGEPNCCRRLLRSVWTQQPAFKPPVPSQSTATHRALAMHAARHC